jgi:hypothetical protein
MTTLSLPWPLSGPDANNARRPAKQPAAEQEQQEQETHAGARTPPMRRRSSFLQRLTHYDAPGVRPPSSRVDPSLKQREGTPFSLWNVIRFAPAAVAKSERSRCVCEAVALMCL